MIKKLYLPLVALLVLALSSCGKMGELFASFSFHFDEAFFKIKFG